MSDDGAFRFVVTGFGPFHGIPTNPTSVLVEELPNYLLGRSVREVSTDDPIWSTLAQCIETKIIETSAEAVKREIRSMQRTLGEYRSVIVLHLGVDGNATQFKLENCAHNDASFRVPDERGYRPTAAPIINAHSIGSTMTTSFDVPVLVKYMNATMLSSTINDESEARAYPIVDVSTDPGRFVCNYIYCCSLDAFGCAKTIEERDAPDHGKVVASSTEAKPSPRVQSLFLHVPPFSRISKERQLLFVAQLMRALYQQKNA